MTERPVRKLAGSDPRPSVRTTCGGMHPGLPESGYLRGWAPERRPWPARHAEHCFNSPSRRSWGQGSGSARRGGGSPGFRGSGLATRGSARQVHEEGHPRLRGSFSRGLPAREDHLTSLAGGDGASRSITGFSWLAAPGSSRKGRTSRKRQRNRPALRGVRKVSESGENGALGVCLYVVFHCRSRQAALIQRSPHPQTYLGQPEAGAR